MKKTIITIVMLSLVVMGYAQKYYTLKECNSDPLKYIEKNYEDNANSYVGKTIGKWADECELKLEEFIPEDYSPWNTPKHLIGKIENIAFEIYYEEYNYDVYIYIAPTTPIDSNDFTDIMGDYEDVWEPKFYDFFKNAKIKKIKVYKRRGDEYNIKYRRP